MEVDWGPSLFVSGCIWLYFRVFVLNYCFGSVACRFIEKTWVEVVDLFEVMDL